MYRILLLFCGLSCLVASEVRISNVAGDFFSAAELKFEDASLLYPDGRLDLRQLNWIEQQADLVDWSTYSQGILLHDGSWIPVSILTAGAKDDSLQVASPFGPLQIPLEFVAGWGDYQTIKSASQHDVLLLNNNNKPYGELYGINNGKVLLQTDLAVEPLHISIEDIRGARLRSQKRTIDGIYLNVYTHPERPPLKVLPGQLPSLALLPSVTFESWDQCQRLQVMGGDRIFLGELNPDSVNEKSLFGKVWPYSVNANIDGTPLFLNQVRYQQGLVLHSYARLSWDLGEAYQSFHTSIGISDQLKREGDCIVRIYGDDKVLWQKESIRGGQPAEKVALNLKAVKILSIEVDYGERFDIGDHCVFADAYLSK